MKKKIKAEKFGTLTEEEILKKAEEIHKRNKPAIEKMPIGSPESAREYLEAVGYDSLPTAKPIQ